MRKPIFPPFIEILTFSASFDITEQVCTTAGAFTPDGKSVKSATIFVKINCANNERLPMDQQNEACNHDGVPAPQSVYDAWIAELPANPSSAAPTAAPTSESPLSTEPAATQPPALTATASQPACDCNENGCTDSSPSCCANGTCKSFPEQCFPRTKYPRVPRHVFSYSISSVKKY